MEDSKLKNKQKPLQFSIIINDIPLSDSQISEIELELNTVVTKHLNRLKDIAGYLALNNVKDLLHGIDKMPPTIIRGTTISRLTDTDLKTVNERLWKN